MSVERRRQMIELDHPVLSITRKCALVSISRSSFYYSLTGEYPLNLMLMRMIDKAFLECPFYGSRQMARHLRRQGYVVGRKRMSRLMAKMGLSPIYQKPRMSAPHPRHPIYKYLLRGLAITQAESIATGTILASLAVAAVLLVAGAMSLAAVVAADVDARRREALVFTLIGASRRDVVLARLAENAVVGVLDAMLGGVTGLAGSVWIVAEALHVDWRPGFLALLLPLGLGVAAAVSAGVAGGLGALPEDGVKWRGTWEAGRAGAAGRSA